MKRDWELVRKILSDLESKPADTQYITSESFQRHSPDIVTYHMQIMDQAGLIKARCLSGESPTCIALSLTWEGHDFLDKIRSETIWNSVKETFKTKGLELSFDAIKLVAGTLISNMLGS